MPGLKCESRDASAIEIGVECSNADEHHASRQLWLSLLGVEKPRSLRCWVCSLRYTRAANPEPAGCTTLTASLHFVPCSGLRCDCGELILIPDLGSLFDSSRYDTTQRQCMPSNARFANPTGQPQMFVKSEPRVPPTTRLLTRPARYSRARIPVCRSPACLICCSQTEARFSKPTPSRNGSHD